MTKGAKILFISLILTAGGSTFLITTQIRDGLRLRKEKEAITQARIRAIKYVQKLRPRKEVAVIVKKVEIDKSKKPWKKTLILEGFEGITSTFELPNKVEGFFLVRAAINYKSNTRFLIYTPGFRAESDGKIYNWRRSTDWRDYVELIPADDLEGTLKHGPSYFAEEWPHSY